MKVNLILSSEEIEQLIHTHITNSGFDTDDKDLDIEFKFDGEDLTAVVSVEELSVTPKPKRTRRTKEQMEADALAEAALHNSTNTPTLVVPEQLIEVELIKVAHSSYEEEAPFALTNPDDLIGSSDLEEPPKTKGIFD